MHAPLRHLTIYYDFVCLILQVHLYKNHAAVSKSLLEHLTEAPLQARWNSTVASLQKDVSATELKDEKEYASLSLSLSVCA